MCCHLTGFWTSNRCWHTKLNVCEKEGFACFLYLIQIFGILNRVIRVDKLGLKFLKILLLYKAATTDKPSAPSSRGSGGHS